MRMYRFSSFLLLLFAAYVQLNAQVFPHEGSVLNYRIVGFSFPSNAGTHNYTIQIASGDYNSEDAFKKNIIISQSIDTNRIIIEVPAFGTQYTWRVMPLSGKSLITKEYSFRHFSTGITPTVDTTANRLLITTHAKQYKDAFIFIDGVGVLYDMNGKPVWYLPLDKEINPANIRDLKLSPFGTVTYMDGSKIYEINYNGDILWQKASSNTPGEKNEQINNQYHHEFTRLGNGHYMVMGSENLLCKVPSPSDSTFTIIDDEKLKKDNNSIYRRIRFGTLMEYDEKGNLVWLWKSSKYFVASDLLNSYDPNQLTDLHDNAFYFDEYNKTIFISFKNINRIIKLQYPKGNVLNTYGKIFTSRTQKKLSNINIENDLFCGQHNCKLSQKGYLYLYNNNTCGTSHTPKVMIMQEVGAGKNSLKKIWEYDCTIESPDTVKSLFFSGGGVQELPDESMLISMGAPYSKISIVSLDKKVLWSALPEKYDPVEKKWQNIELYRASIITTRKDLEQLIWNSEKE